jgi:hypothetical protein
MFVLAWFSWFVLEHFTFLIKAGCRGKLLDQGRFLRGGESLY